MPQMHTTFPSSQALVSATYDPDTTRLDILFSSGRTYTFENVPQRVFEELRDAPSPGQYYHGYIKGAY